MSYFIRIVKLEGVAIYHTFYTFVLKARFFICRNFGSVMANDNQNSFSLRLVILLFGQFLDLWIMILSEIQRTSQTQNTLDLSYRNTNSSVMVDG